MDPKPVIVASDILKSYGSLTVVNASRVEIYPNIITTVVGPSGAGKSTLLLILGTLLRPNQGEVMISGKSIWSLGDGEISKFRNESLGFVFQAHNLLPEFTAIENVALPAMIGGAEERKYMAKAADLLDFMGLSARIKHKPHQLSGGEQQRVAIARALINDPKIILADEPTGNLDSKNAKEIQELFVKLKKEKGYTFLIVTHNMELAGSGDKMISMKDGEIIGYS